MVACIQSRSYATEFFKLPKNKKKGDKGADKSEVDKQKQLEKYFENVSEEERARILEFEDTRTRQEEEASRHKKEERGRLEAIEYQNFLYWAKKMRADLEQRVAHANDPMFSEEARKKAYDLHKKHPSKYRTSSIYSTILNEFCNNYQSVAETTIIFVVTLLYNRVNLK
jgi:tRNA A37 N6-isopentenylltransferase MiaA